MSDARQTSKISGLVLCINVGEIQLPVDVAKVSLETLAKQRSEVQTQIDAADQDDITLISSLQRKLAGIESEFERLDSPMKIRHGHMYNQPAADSA